MTARITHNSIWVGMRNGAPARLKVVGRESVGVKEHYTELSYDLQVEATKDIINVPAAQMQDLIKKGKLRPIEFRY